MEMPIIPGDPYPYGLLCFAMMLPGATEEDRNQTVQQVTKWLDRYERSIGGRGLQIVKEGYNLMEKDAARYEWILDPVLKDEPYVRQRMALVALKLRNLENQIMLGGMS